MMKYYQWKDIKKEADENDSNRTTLKNARHNI